MQFLFILGAFLLFLLILAIQIHWVKRPKKFELMQTLSQIERFHPPDQESPDISGEW
jgi:hypothetical protein